MPSLTLYDDGTHRNLMLEDFGHSQMVQANQHLVVHDGAGMILDPGGHRVYNRALSETMVLLGRSTLKYIFLSHQDPDIVAALNGWLMATDAVAYVSALWLRFIPHFGLDSLVIDRLKPIPDEGMHLDLAGAHLVLLPAHFLHSAGNFSVYDPVSKILYSGDIGASFGMDDQVVADFPGHVKYMEGFHRRYLASRKAVCAWVDMVRSLDIETIAPQHGALFRGKEMSGRFLDWLQGVDCGVDLLPEIYVVPVR
jgi:flavorubredoxin